MRDLGARILSWKKLLRPLECIQIHTDRNVTIRVTVHLDPGAMNLLDPGIQVLLRLDDGSLIRRVRSRKRNTHRHRSLRERAVDCVLSRGSKSDPGVAEPGLYSTRYHRVEYCAV